MPSPLVGEPPFCTVMPYHDTTNLEYLPVASELLREEPIIAINEKVRLNETCAHGSISFDQQTAKRRDLDTDDLPLPRGPREAPISATHQTVGISSGIHLAGLRIAEDTSFGNDGRLRGVRGQ